MASILTFRKGTERLKKDYNVDIKNVSRSKITGNEPNIVSTIQCTGLNSPNHNGIKFLLTEIN